MDYVRRMSSETFCRSLRRAGDVSTGGAGYSGNANDAGCIMPRASSPITSAAFGRNQRE